MRDDVLELLTPAEVDIIRQHRAKERAHKEAKRILQDEVVALESFLYGETWVTREGEVLHVAQMTPRHAGNAVRFAEGRALRLLSLRSRLGIPGGSVPRFPLVQALQARAAEDPSLLERWRDRRSTRRFERSKNR